MVHGDTLRLVQVVGNLLTNTIKFTPAPGCLRIEVGRIGNQAALSVKDNGIGMPPEWTE